MPTRWNLDHQPRIISYSEPAVPPGEPHEFTDEEIAAGLAGHWSAKDPRKRVFSREKATAEAAQTQPAEPEKE